VPQEGRCSNSIKNVITEALVGLSRHFGRGPKNPWAEVGPKTTVEEQENLLSRYVPSV
jgi:hypothetical protein